MAGLAALGGDLTDFVLGAEWGASVDRWKGIGATMGMAGRERNAPVGEVAGVGVLSSGHSTSGFEGENCLGILTKVVLGLGLFVEVCVMEMKFA